MVEFAPGMGNRIKDLRDREGLSQAEFGQVLGVSQQYVGHLEMERRRPGLALLFVIAFKFKVREKWLKEGKGKLAKRPVLSVV